MTLALVLAFVLSGAAGLIYESIWSRYLGLFLGHSAYAQVLVLVIFLGGMAGGAVLAARFSKRIIEPLFAYAVIEAVVAVMGMMFHGVYLSVTAFAYQTLMPALPGPVAVTIAKWTIAALLILPQSVLLGATFPLMSAGVMRRLRTKPGRVLALLYFANSFGAALGVLAAGFVLIAVAGLPGTVMAAAILNLLVAGMVIVALRVERARAKSMKWPAVLPDRAEGREPMRPLIVRLLLVVSFGTALASFAYEIAWIRMLSLVMGSATHSFELMLSAFILGLALGALWIRSRVDSIRDPLFALGAVQWTMGLLALATMPVYLASFEWTSHLLATFSNSVPGYHAFNIARYAIALAVMLPATFCAGVTLPLITHALVTTGTGEKAVGLVYGVNTLGSIVGVALAGLVLMPVLGVKGLLIAGAILDVALGIALFAVSRERTRDHRPAWMWMPGLSATGPRHMAAAAAIAATIAVLVLAGASTFDPNRLASGVYRHGKLDHSPTADFTFYEDGRTATVAVKRNPAAGTLTLLTNGKPDASVGLDLLREDQPPRTLSGDESTQLLLALLTLAHAPEAKTGAVIGQGSGVSSHLLLGSSNLERLVTVEIEPEMIDASRAFYPLNRRVFDDPRSEFVIDDAKTYFAANRSRFDLILSEPSNPWVSGVSGLFTTEFYGAVRHHLSDEGVFGQWLHLYEINDDLVLRVMSALHQNFEHYEAFLVADGDMLVVATNRPWGLPADWSIVEHPGVAEDLARFPRFTEREFESMRVASRNALAPLIEFGPAANSDFFPVLDLGAERARYLQQFATGFASLNADRFSLARGFARRQVPLEGPLDVTTPGIPGVHALALGERLRRYDGTMPAYAPSGRELEAMHAKRSLEAWTASGLAPGDWRLWAHTFVSVEQDLHGTASGIVDHGFYDSVERYLDTTNAPAEARAVVGFTRSLGKWNYEEAVQYADVLLAAADRGEMWMHPDLLADGAVLANMLRGDREGARRVHKAMWNRSTRQSGDIRLRLRATYSMLTNPPGGAVAGSVEP